MIEQDDVEVDIGIDELKATILVLDNAIASFQSIPASVGLTEDEQTLLDEAIALRTKLNFKMVQAQ